ARRLAARSRARPRRGRGSASGARPPGRRPAQASELSDRLRHVTMRAMAETAAGLEGLPLRDFHPRSALRNPQRHPSRAKFAAVDAHNHLGRWLTRSERWMVPDVGALLELMDAQNVSAIVNLDGLVGEELELNLDRYDRAHPGRFATFTRLDWTELETPGFTERLVASIGRAAAAGARGLKIWKDLGLHFRDHHGELVATDDARLFDIWETAAELGLPI